MVTDGIAAEVIGQLTSGSAGGNAATEASHSFNVAFEKAQARQAEGPDSTGLPAVFAPLLSLGEQSSKLAADADPMLTSELRPSELLQITMRSHQFLFHCELVANVANRASDGVQQLFRQQT